MGARAWWFLVAGLVLAALAALSRGHVRLHHPTNGNPLYWNSPGALQVVINDQGSDDIAGKSELAALRNAIAAWNAVPGSAALLVENSDPAQTARTDWEQDDIHLLYFDEQDESGYFPAGSGVVAITPIWFSAAGKITDADVLFNGQGFSFTTSAQSGQFDVQDVAVHELGHLLGLDHSGSAGSSLYPYVDPSIVLHRSLSADDLAGLSSVYPADASTGLVRGTVRRASDASPVPGALVLARDEAGREAASILSDAAGVFVLSGLSPGSYSVYARPLDEPVAAFNLTPGWSVETDFSPAAYPPGLAVAAGQITEAGALDVGGDVALSLGKNSNKFPLRATAGQTTAFTLSGTGLVNGSQLSASDPDLSVAGALWLGSQVQFSLAVPVQAEPGHVDLSVQNPFGDLSILPGAIEITPEDPVVESLSPDQGAAAGGQSLTVYGSGFRPGLRVVIDDQVYPEGQGGGAVLIDGGTLTLTTLALDVGTHDVVVIDATGVEGRLADGFTAGSFPVISSVFPVAGDAQGGTEIVLRGENFSPGLAVRIDGLDQPQVVVDSSTRVRVSSTGGVPGGPYLLELENPGGALATAAFAYVASPDPQVTSVSPGAGSAGGGELVTLDGANFQSGMEVRFGADPDTGLGGELAANVIVLDEHTLTALTPAHAAGSVGIVVSASNGQAASLASAFSFEASSAGGGGGGGGCTVGRGPVDGSGAGRELLAGAWWLLALVACCLWRARRAQRLERAWAPRGS